MFFAEDRIKAVREMILSEDVNGRKKALDKLLPFQKSDFIGIFTAMEGLPVTIRFLDPPLHEFLPQEEKDIVELAREKTNGRYASQYNNQLYSFLPKPKSSKRSHDYY